jgi:hypothetical protein
MMTKNIASYNNLALALIEKRLDCTHLLEQLFIGRQKNIYLRIVISTGLSLVPDLFKVEQLSFNKCLFFWLICQSEFFIFC